MGDKKKTNNNNNNNNNNTKSKFNFGFQYVKNKFNKKTLKNILESDMAPYIYAEDENEITLFKLIKDFIDKKGSTKWADEAKALTTLIRSQNIQDKDLENEILTQFLTLLKKCHHEIVAIYAAPALYEGLNTDRDLYANQSNFKKSFAFLNTEIISLKICFEHLIKEKKLPPTDENQPKRLKDHIETIYARLATLKTMEGQMSDTLFKHYPLADNDTGYAAYAAVFRRQAQLMFQHYQAIPSLDMIRLGINNYNVLEKNLFANILLNKIEAFRKGFLRKLQASPKYILLFETDDKLQEYIEVIAKIYDDITATLQAYESSDTLTNEEVLTLHKKIERHYVTFFPAARKIAKHIHNKLENEADIKLNELRPDTKEKIDAFLNSATFNINQIISGTTALYDTLLKEDSEFTLHDKMIEIQNNDIKKYQLILELLGFCTDQLISLQKQITLSKTQSNEQVSPSKNTKLAPVYDHGVLSNDVTVVPKEINNNENQSDAQKLTKNSLWEKTGKSSPQRGSDITFGNRG